MDEKCVCHINGYRVKDSVARERIESLTYDDIGAAPSGFGLGAAQRITLAQLDETRKPGWYYINSDTNISIGGLSVKKWFLHVTAWDTGVTACVQTIVPAMQKYRELKRYYYNEEWTEWIYTNAPMVYGTEYLTNEIYNGKPVYVKTVNIGALPNDATVDAGGWGSGGKFLPIRCSACAYVEPAEPNACAIPFKLEYAEVNVSVSSWGIFVKTVGTWSTQKAAVTIWYTKD